MSPVGHIAMGFASRNLEPRIPLWACLVIPCLTDIEYGILSVAGIESQAFCPYSHSLAGAVLLSLAAGIAVFAFIRDRKSALFVVGLAMSHWVADFLVWANLSLAPGFSTDLGLGLYTRIGFSMETAGLTVPTLIATGFELALLAAGIATMRLSRRK